MPAVTIAGIESTTKVAFLIMAHHHPEHLRRLLHRLEDARVFFFVHVDGKSELTPFLEAVKGIRNCAIIKERKKVYWMGFSMVEAQRCLMEVALSHGERFKYYILLTGVNYPIKSIAAILDFLDQNSVEFIKHFALSDNEDWLHKIERFHVLDFPLLNRREVFRTTRSAILCLPIYLLFRCLQRVLPSRRYLKGLTPHGGSAHWALTHECVKHIVQFLNQEKEFLAFYRFTHAPDEMVFHTIILNSKFAANVAPHSETRLWPRNRRSKHVREYGLTLTYDDWDRSREGPAILDERDLDKLLCSGKLFARKFDPVKSKKLLEMLDREHQLSVL